MTILSNGLDESQKESVESGRIYKVYTQIEKETLESVKDTLISNGDFPYNIMEIENQCIISFTDLTILKNKVRINFEEIEFIKNLWETLNKELYGYTDENLSLRYRGIDELSPLTDI